jgi:hypothetical protein
MITAIRAIVVHAWAVVTVAVAALSGALHPAPPAPPGAVSAASGALTATLRAAGHHPRANTHWPISFTVDLAGRPARASVSYEYLLGTAVVAHRSHYTFTGRFSDVFTWPPAAVGYPLTFRAVIVSEGVTVDLDYPVQVVR